MMDRASISVDTITSPATSKTGKPGFEPGFSLFKAANQKKARWRWFYSANVSFSCRINRRTQPPSLILILAHRPKIVFGVLEVILRHDPIPPQSFGAGKGQIAFIASMEVLNITSLVADESGRLISVGGLRSSQHSVGITFVLWRGCPVNTVDPLRWAHRANILRRFKRRLPAPFTQRNCCRCDLPLRISSRRS
jgi:hypothetical protein